MVKPLAHTVFILSWLLGCSSLWAQSNTLPLEFEHIQEQQGLSQNLINTIFQDRDGFLWIGSYEGLNRFDGSHFAVFKPNTANKRSINKLVVHSLGQDKRGYIWVGTSKGVDYYNPDSQAFTHIDSVAGKPLDGCYNILCDRAGNVWFSDVVLGLIRYQPNINRFDLFPISTTDKRALAARITKNGLLEDPDQKGLWMTTVVGLHYLDTATGIFYSYRNNPDSLEILKKHNTSAIAMDGQSKVIFADNTNRQVIVFEKSTRRIIKSISLISQRNYNPFPVGTIFVDRNHNFWISSWSFTMFFIDAKTDTAIEFFHDDAVKTSVAANFFWDAWQHPDGSIWLGTLNGISITNPERAFYKIYDLKRFDSSINENFGITSMVAQDSTWWIGTPQNLLHFYPASNRMELHRLPIQEAVDYAYNRPQVLLHPNQHQLFIRFSKQIVIFDITQKKFTPLVIPEVLHLPYFDNGFTRIDIQWPYLWVFGAFRAGLRYHLQQHNWEQIPIPVNPDPGKGFNVRSVGTDHQGTYWLDAFPVGFYWFKPGQKTFVRRSRKSLPEFYVNLSSFTLGQHDEFWGPSPGFGLVQYTPHTDTYRLWTEQDGLGLVSCAVSRMDDFGQIWLGKYNKFSVFYPKRRHARAFKMPLSESDFKYMNYMLKLPNGHILASLKGYLIEFMPSRYIERRPSPQLLINSVSTPDTSYLVTNKVTPIPLSVTENNFSVDYSVLSSYPGYTYRFKLEGYDDRWIEAGRKTIASYTKIPGGDYKFRIKAVDDDAEMAEASLLITVDTEFYNKPWFRLLILLLIAGLAVAFLQYRTHQTAQVHRLQMQATRLERDKTDIQYQNLINHLNPHFLFNSLTSLNSLIVTEPKQASRFLQKLSAIYRYILQNKEKETVSVEHELNFVRHYIDLQKSRFEDGLQITLDVPGEYLSRGIVPVTLQNLFENAIKHNTIEDEKPLRIRVYVDEDYLCIENSLQKKHFVETSNKQGLDSLKTLYSYLSDRPIVIIEDYEAFIVKIPLV